MSRTSRSIALVLALSLSAPGCLFLADTGGTTNNTNNDVQNNPQNNVQNNPNACDVSSCMVGQTCLATGECGVVSCGFTTAEDGYRSSCMSPGDVCHLNPTGMGFCAPPCANNSDCVPGTRCDQVYSDFVGGSGGLCVTDSASVTCDDTRYEGLCVPGEECVAGECLGEPPVCLLGPLEESDECEFVPCRISSSRKIVVRSPPARSRIARSRRISA